MRYFAPETFPTFTLISAECVLLKLRYFTGNPRERLIWGAPGLLGCAVLMWINLFVFVMHILAPSAFSTGFGGITLFFLHQNFGSTRSPGGSFLQPLFLKFEALFVRKNALTALAKGDAGLLVKDIYDEWMFLIDVDCCLLLVIKYAGWSRGW